MKKIWSIYSKPSCFMSSVYTAIKALAMSIGTYTHKVGAHRSWDFEGLQLADRQLLNGCSWKVGNGLNLKTFSTVWFHGTIPIANSSVPLSQIPLSKVSDFIDVDNQVWKATMVRKFFSHEDSKYIISMELPSHNAPSFMFWSHSVSELFTTKTVYAQLIKTTTSLHRSVINISGKVFKILWHLPILPKWKISYGGYYLTVFLLRNNFLNDKNWCTHSTTIVIMI